jgi:hypothetical protein
MQDEEEESRERLNVDFVHVLAQYRNHNVLI